MRLIDLDELLKYPIRLDSYDKKNGNEHFVFGIESVLEYAENLPTIDAVDLISRKDAIEAVEKAKTARSADGEIFCAKINAQMNIQHLPSVQPEPKEKVEVVRCKDCKIAQNNRYNSRVDGKCSVLCEHVTTEDGRYELKVFRNANDFCNYGKRREE